MDGVGHAVAHEYLPARRTRDGEVAQEAGGQDRVHRRGVVAPRGDRVWTGIAGGAPKISQMTAMRTKVKKQASDKNQACGYDGYMQVSRYIPARAQHGGRTSPVPPGAGAGKPDAWC